jgi:sugar lactone lactonase YvrE
MNAERLHLPGQMMIETNRDANGRYFIAYGKHASMFFRDAAELRRWLKLPIKTPSREAFDSWITSMQSNSNPDKII